MKDWLERLGLEIVINPAIPPNGMLLITAPPTNPTPDDFRKSRVAVINIGAA